MSQTRSTNMKMYCVQGLYVAPDPEQQAAQRKDQILYSVNGLEVPTATQGFMFSWEEAAANGGGAEAR